MLKKILLSILVSSGSILLAQDNSVMTWLDTSRILIGDQIYFNIRMTQPANTHLDLHLPSDTLTGNVEILDPGAFDTLMVGDSQLQINRRMLITCFDTGRYEIKPVYAEQSSEAGMNRYYSDFLTLEVVNVDITPADSTDVIFDIVGPRKAPVSFLELLPWILLILAAGGLVYWLGRYFRKRAGKEDEGEATNRLPSEPAYIIAFRELDKLDRQELWKKEKYKEHYTILTEILRTYIDYTFGISSMEMTSFETLRELKKKGLNNANLFDLLRDVFENADLSKFAKYKPDNDFNSKSIDHVRHFVKETMPVSEEVSSDTDNETGKEVDHE